MMIPSFLLKKLYVRGSFKNSASGFQIALMNSLAPGTLVGVGSIQIDGRDIPTERIFITVNDGAPIKASDITPNAPRMFPLNTKVNFSVDDQPLEKGVHHLKVSVSTREAGELKIDAEDSIE
jgi:hydroxymethylglutaryl-CoA reductase (NADPH)